MRILPDERVTDHKLASSPRTCSGVQVSAHPQAGWCAARWMPDQVRHDGSEERREAEANREVFPHRIQFLDLVDFPLTSPALDPLFAGDGVGHGFGRRVPDEAVDAVAFGEAVEAALAVLDKATDKVRRYPHVQCAAKSTGEDVDAGLFVAHAPDCAARWTPEQVRGDGGAA